MDKKYDADQRILHFHSPAEKEDSRLSSELRSTPGTTAPLCWQSLEARRIELATNSCLENPPLFGESTGECVSSIKKQLKNHGLNQLAKLSFVKGENSGSIRDHTIFDCWLYQRNLHYVYLWWN